MSGISIILVFIVAFLAGVEGILDEFEFHQPLVACTLIGLVTGHLPECLILGGSLQMIALGWANIGAAVSPDAALAAVASAIILVLGGQGSKGVDTAIAVAVPLAVAGLFLTMVVRTISVAVVHQMDRAAENANFRMIEVWQLIAIALQGLRIAIPAMALCFIPAEIVQNFLSSMPAWLTDGMSIGGGMVVAVGYAMVINMMATPEVYTGSLAVPYHRLLPCSHRRPHSDRSRRNRYLHRPYLSETVGEHRCCRSSCRYRRSARRYLG